MLTLKSKLLLIAIAAMGIGMGALSGLADGAYSALCLFWLPILVALAGVSIIADLSRPLAVVEKKPHTTKTALTSSWEKAITQEVSRQWTN